MATFQSINGIEIAIKKGLTEVPNDYDFIDALKTTVRNAIYERVYSFPEGGYKRRYDEGGLGDKRQMAQSHERGGRSRGTVDDEGFMVVSESWNMFENDLNAGEAITISIKDDAPPQHPAPYDLDYMVEHGIGKGNMGFERPFYDTADKIVSSHSEMLSEWAADAIRKYL